MTHWTEKEWVGFARRNVAWRKGQESEVEAIGRECYARAQRGENACLFHVCATMVGKPCVCAECRPDLGSGQGMRPAKR